MVSSARALAHEASCPIHRRKSIHSPSRLNLLRFSYDTTARRLARSSEYSLELAKRTIAIIYPITRSNASRMHSFGR